MTGKKPTPLAGFTPPHRLTGLSPDTPILVALSGGADSMALLHLLIGYAKTTAAPISVAHVNHRLRGAESDADAAFCKSVAKAHGLPFYELEIDVAALAASNGRGVEEEAREVRYHFFEELMKAHSIPLVATAHHADDNAETVLLHMTRGSGLRGLRGIPPVRALGEGQLIRPLLGASKEEILSYCKQNHIEYVTDQTNEDTDLARNRIRHCVIPELRKLNPETVESIMRLCRTVAREDDFLDECARAFITRNQTADGGLPTEALHTAHPALAARAAALLLKEQCDEIASTHVESVLDLAKKSKPHATLHIGNGIETTVENHCLYVRKSVSPSPASPYQLPIGEGMFPIPEADMLLVVENTDSSPKNQKSFKNIYKKATTTKISSAKISGSLYARPRREGDVILAGGMHKKVKKLMCDKKIPLTHRDRIPLLCDDDGIVWIPAAVRRDGCEGNDLQITLYYND